MVDQVPHDGGLWAALVAGGLGVITALTGWIGNRQIKRIDQLERRSVQRKEMDASVNKMCTEVRTGFETLHKKIDRHIDYHLEKKDG